MHTNVGVKIANVGVMHASVLESGLIDCFLIVQVKVMNS